MAELPPSIAFILDEFRGNTIDVHKVRKRFNDVGFLNDLSDQCESALFTFDDADYRKLLALTDFRFLRPAG